MENRKYRRIITILKKHSIHGFTVNPIYIYIYIFSHTTGTCILRTIKKGHE